MDPEDLRCFITVAETLHFGAAAERVSLSAPAFSDRVQRLEEELGVPLLLRTTRRVRLTEAGERLLPQARKVLDELARCAAVARAEGSSLPFSLTLGTRFELGLSWLVPAVRDLRRPNRTLHLYMGDTPALLERLERGAIDAALLSARLTRPHIEYALLHEEEYAFVAGEGQVSGPEDAADLTLIDVSPDLPLFRYLLDALPESRPWRFGGHLYMGGIAAIRAQVLAGLGVAVLPRYFVEPDLRTGALIELMPKIRPKSDLFRLLWRSDHPRRAELEDLAAELRARPLC